MGRTTGFFAEWAQAGAATVLATALAACGGGGAADDTTRVIGGQTGQPGSSGGPPTQGVLYALVSPDGTPGTESLAGFGFDQAGIPAALNGFPLDCVGDGNRNSKASDLVVTPDRRFVIASHNTSKRLASYRTSPQGQLTAAGTIDLADDPSDLALHPNGHTLYASLGQSGKVAVVEVDSTTGGLVEIVGSPFTVGTSVRDLAVHPSGSFLATGHMFGADTGVRVHRLDAVGAVTSPPVQSVAQTGRQGGSIAWSPAGDLLYARDLDLGVFVFRVAPLGTLTAVAGSPFSVGGFSSDLVVHPNGELVYVLRGNASGELHGFRVNAGALAAVAGSPFVLPSGGYQHMGLNAVGTRLYLTERSIHDLAVFEVQLPSGIALQLGAPQPVPGTQVSPKRAPGPVLVVD